METYRRLLASTVANLYVGRVNRASPTIGLQDLGRVILCGVAMLCLCFGTGVAAREMPSPAARVAWGFDRSDLTPHPGVRFGVLPNGLRYALMRHEGSSGGLSVRLRFDAGALVEEAGQSGFMHVLEHLIFHGSANLPQGALLFMLPAAGMARTADFGGFTSHDETVYRLDLTRADARARATALTVMSEIARDLRFDRRTVEAAKAEVRAEIAMRDRVADRIAAARDAFFFPGTAARGAVVGTDASVRRATGAALRRLYAGHYVPARATLVMVGDFDPLLVEAEIATRLSNWTGDGVGAAAALPARTAVDESASNVRAQLFVERGAPSAVAIATVTPSGGADAVAGRDTAFLQHLGAEMLARRLTRITTGASSALWDHVSAGRVASIDIPARDGDWRGALARGKAVLASVLASGFTQSELDAQIAVSRQALAPRAAPATSKAIADAIVDAVSRDLLYTEPGDGSATDAYLARVRLVDVNAAFRAAWAGPGQAIFVTHDRSIANAQAAILSAWREVP